MILEKFVLNRFIKSLDKSISFIYVDGSRFTLYRPLCKTELLATIYYILHENWCNFYFRHSGVCNFRLYRKLILIIMSYWQKLLKALKEILSSYFFNLLSLEYVGGVNPLIRLNMLVSKHYFILKYRRKIRIYAINILSYLLDLIHFLPLSGVEKICRARLGRCEFRHFLLTKKRCKITDFLRRRIISLPYSNIVE